MPSLTPWKYFAKSSLPAKLLDALDKKLLAFAHVHPERQGLFAVMD